MAQVRVFYDRAGNTLTVWFGDPEEEYVSEETSAEIVLMKDRAGQVIGLEKLNYSVPPPGELHFSFEAASA